MMKGNCRALLACVAALFLTSVSLGAGAVTNGVAARGEIMGADDGWWWLLRDDVTCICCVVFIVACVLDVVWPSYDTATALWVDGNEKRNLQYIGRHVITLFMSHVKTHAAHVGITLTLFLLLRNTVHLEIDLSAVEGAVLSCYSLILVYYVSVLLCSIVLWLCCRGLMRYDSPSTQVLPKLPQKSSSQSLKTKTKQQSKRRFQLWSPTQINRVTTTQIPSDESILQHSYISQLNFILWFPSLSCVAVLVLVWLWQCMRNASSVPIMMSESASATFSYAPRDPDSTSCEMHFNAIWRLGESMLGIFGAGHITEAASLLLWGSLAAAIILLLLEENACAAYFETQLQPSSSTTHNTTKNAPTTPQQQQHQHKPTQSPLDVDIILGNNQIVLFCVQLLILFVTFVLLTALYTTTSTQTITAIGVTLVAPAAITVLVVSPWIMTDLVLCKYMDSGFSTKPQVAHETNLDQQKQQQKKTN
ncbi:hypothetical protein Pelo_5351 [Pelomyxa schiedti]|nr:hypothetical protein Pelo_5351 [Pelomyxa schiedti]